jgi:hypothetical protein
MNLRDLLRHRGKDANTPARPPSREDARALKEYERMLRTAPRSTIVQAHVEAFEKLTPAQLDLVYDRFSTANEMDGVRPADAKASSLAKAGVDAEMRKPGAIRRSMSSDGTLMNAIVLSSIVDSITWFAISSVIWSSWDHGQADTDTADADAGASNTADASDMGGASGFWDFGW